MTSRISNYFSGCLALLLLLGITSSALAQPKGPPPAAAVIVAKVVEREVNDSQTFVGSVVPVKISKIGSAVDGRVVDFPVNLGDRVTKDQTLAQLLTGLLEIDLKGAEAELRNRQSAHDELRRSRPEEIEQSRARLAGKISSREYAVARLERFKKMNDKRALTEDQIEEITSMAVQAHQAYLDAKISLELAEKGARDEVVAQFEAKIAVQEQEIARIKDQIIKHTIKAPFDGYIVAEHTEKGEWVVKGGLVATVAALDDVDVEIPVLETYVAHLKVGDEARIEINALPKEVFIGRVAEIVPSADARSKNFPVRVRLQNKLVDGLPQIKAGMFARVALAVGKPIVAPVVMKDAVVLGGPTPMVWVMDSDAADPKKGAVRAVSIEMGIASGDFIQVKGEIKEGQFVVVQGNERLRPGQSVQMIREVTPAATTAAVKNEVGETR